MLVFPLFCCLGRALVRYGGNAIGFGILGDVAVKVGQEVWNAWNKEKNEAQRRAELQEIARVAAQECCVQVEEVIRDVAADQPAEIRRQLANYLNQVPELIRQSLRRPEDPQGQSVPPGLSLQRSEDLLPFLALEQLAPTAPADSLGPRAARRVRCAGARSHRWGALLRFSHLLRNSAVCYGIRAGGLTWRLV